MRWKDDITNQIRTGIESNNVGINSNKGSNSYVDIVEDLHPSYIHELFRITLEVKGTNSSFDEIAHYIYTLSGLETEQQIQLNFCRRQIQEWFANNDGKHISPVEKP